MRKLRKTQIYINLLAVAVALISIAPLLWMAISSFKVSNEVLAVPFRLFPRVWSAEGYERLFADNLFKRSIGLTFFGATVYTLLSLLINSMSAYTYARLEFPFKRCLWAYSLLPLFIPWMAILVPSFIVVSKLNMLDTLFVLIIPGLVSAGNMLFLRQFYLNIPSSLEEACSIDGAGKYRTYFSVFIPLSIPPFVVLGIATFLSYWNAIVWPSMTISDPRMYQIMQVISLYRSDYIIQWNMLLAGATLAAIPTIVLFLIFQKKLIQGLKISGLK
jgi:multiple sugar transport system permease protein